jgi:hypothetical protein
MEALQCQKGTSPFIYLGFASNYYQALKGLLHASPSQRQRRLSVCSMYLSYGDKLRLVNSVLSSLSTFYLSTIKVYQLVLGEFDKYRRQCQWRKNDLEAKSSRLAAYELFYRPKDQDELDVVNFSSQNNCLLMKHLHRFYNRASLPWIKLI